MKILSRILLLSLFLLAASACHGQPRYIIVNPSTGALTGPSRTLFQDNTNLLVTAILDHFYTQAEAAAAFQPLDAELSAFAGLAIVADRLPYGNGSGTLGLTPFTAFARNLLDDADAATMRTTLGVGSGTGDMLSSNNLSDLTDDPTARINLGVIVEVEDGNELDTFTALTWPIRFSDAGDINFEDSATPGEVHANVRNSSINSTMIIDDTINNGDINSSAAINTSKLADGSVSNTEFQYLNGVTSNVQDQLNGKLANVVEDTTPQLGGDMGAQGNDITDIALLSMRNFLLSSNGVDSLSVGLQASSGVVIISNAASGAIYVQKGAGSISIADGVITLEAGNNSFTLGETGISYDGDAGTALSSLKEFLVEGPSNFYGAITNRAGVYFNPGSFTRLIATNGYNIELVEDAPGQFTLREPDGTGDLLRINDGLLEFFSDVKFQHQKLYLERSGGFPGGVYIESNDDYLGFLSAPAGLGADGQWTLPSSFGTLLLVEDLDTADLSGNEDVSSKLPTADGTAARLAGTIKNLTRIQHVHGTIANGGTLTIDPSTNFHHATFTGATATIDPTRDLVDGESVDVHVFNTAGAQVISVPSSYRYGATAETTTITNSEQHTLTWINFTRANGTNYIATLGDDYDPSGSGSYQAANANLDELASEGSTGTGAFLRASAAPGYTISGEVTTADDTVTLVWESATIETNLTFTVDASLRAGGPTNRAIYKLFSSGYRQESSAALDRITFEQQIDLTKTNHTTATLSTNAWFGLSSSNTVKLFAKGLATESMRWHARGEFLSTTNGPATEGASTTLFEDNFEGDLSKWTIGAGDPSVTITASNPIKETGSLIIPDPSSGTWYITSDTYTAPNEIWIAFIIHGTANPAATQNTFRFYDASANSLGLFTVSSSGTMRTVVEGGNSPTLAGSLGTTTDGGFSIGTKVLIRYTADTGSGARMTTYFTSGSDWDGGRSSSVGSALNTAAYHAFFLNSTGNMDYRFDEVKVSTEVIPWNWAD